MRDRRGLWVLAGWLTVACAQVATHAQEAAPTREAAHTQEATQAPEAAGFRLGTGLGGQMVFVQHCASCHADSGDSPPGEGRAPTLTSLQQYPPERVLDALVGGKMMSVGSQLRGDEQRAVAEWLGGRPLGAGDAGDAAKMKNRCASSLPVVPAGKGDWNGWSYDERNARFQPEPGLTAAQLPALRLQWAFGLPGGAEAYSQPTVVGGHVLVGGDNGFVYSLRARSGCVEWSFQAKAGVRGAPTVAPVGQGGGHQAVFFGDMKGYVYAVDARDGRAIWITRVDDQPMVKITGSVTAHDGRLYVGTTTGEEVTAAAPTYACCRTRGTVVALSAANGAMVWKTYMVPEEPKPIGRNGLGTPTWGPAGVGVWSAPTVDAKRGLLYVGTGDAYTEPAAPLSDSIVALDLRTGRVVWHHQDTPDDAWLAGCVPDKPFGNCPAHVGPDWDFGASVMLLRERGRDLLVGAHKGGFVVAVDPGKAGAVVWRRGVALQTAGASGEIVFGGAGSGDRVYFGLNSGDLLALDTRDGAPAWRTKLTSAPPAKLTSAPPAKLTLARPGRVGISSAVTAIPGAVLTGAWDGVLRAFDSNTGGLLWSFDTARSFPTVNGVSAKGGSMGAPGPVVAEGMVFVASGYIGVGNGMPGNVVLAFAPK